MFRSVVVVLVARILGHTVAVDVATFPLETRNDKRRFMRFVLIVVLLGFTVIVVPSD